MKRNAFALQSLDSQAPAPAQSPQTSNSLFQRLTGRFTGAARPHASSQAVPAGQANATAANTKPSSQPANAFGATAGLTPPQHSRQAAEPAAWSRLPANAFQAAPQHAVQQPAAAAPRNAFANHEPAAATTPPQQNTGFPALGGAQAQHAAAPALSSLDAQLAAFTRQTAPARPQASAPQQGRAQPAQQAHEPVASQWVRPEPAQPAAQPAQGRAAGQQPSLLHRLSAAGPVNGAQQRGGPNDGRGGQRGTQAAGTVTAEPQAASFQAEALAAQLQSHAPRTSRRNAFAAQQHSAQAPPADAAQHSIAQPGLLRAPARRTMPDSSSVQNASALAEDAQASAAAAQRALASIAQPSASSGRQADLSGASDAMAIHREAKEVNKEAMVAERRANEHAQRLANVSDTVRHAVVTESELWQKCSALQVGKLSAQSGQPTRQVPYTFTTVARSYDWQHLVRSGLTCQSGVLQQCC